MVTTDTPRIYVASLSDYNAGILHGVWIDATLESDEIYEQVQAMLAKSPAFERFPAGGPAEEWAIHDYEGFDGWRLSEWESFEKVSAIAQAIEEHGPAFSAWLSVIDNPSDFDNLADEFEQHFRGEWESEEDYARETVSELGWGDIPAGKLKCHQGDSWGHEFEIDVFEQLESYLDWELIAREMFSHGNYTSAAAPDFKVYVFEDEV